MSKSITTRREFMQKGMVLLSATSTIPTFLDRTLLAMANPADMPRVQQPNGKDGKILVVIQLSGGNDGLNTVIPFSDDVYHRNRNTIGHDAKTVLKLNDRVGLHPNLGGLKSLYDNGQMSIVQGVGYPNPNRSHFRSMDIWQTAEPEKDGTTGWIGRYFDNACPGCDPHVGMAIGEIMPLAMKGEKVLPLSFDRPENYRYNGRDKDRYQKLNTGAAPTTNPATQPAKPQQPRANAKVAKADLEVITPASQLDFLTRTAMDAQLSSEQILELTRNHKSPQQYPGGEFGNALHNVAALIAGGLPTRVYYVSLGGFDTHAQERQRHDQLMTQLAQGISAFMADLKAQRNDDRVLVMTFSEFGRRVQQNASGGTDHGAAAPMFLFGSALKTGILGDHPSLTNLDQGDLKYQVDFRNVYATVLEQWMDSPSKPILGEQFRTLNAIKV